MSTNPTTITATPGEPFIAVEREFEAAPAKLYRAYTEPELVARWLGPRERAMTVDTYDARTGGAYRYLHTAPGQRDEAFRGVFHSVAPDRIIQTFEWEGAPGEVCLESVTFEDLGGRTRVVTRSVFPSVTARDAAVASGMEHGINDSMDRLAELVTD